VTDGKKTYIGFNTCRLAIKVKAGTTGCNITCPEMDEVLTGASSSYHTGVTAADKKGLFEGEQSNPDKEYDANGDMYLTWYVQIPDVNSGFQDFNFTLTNQLNSENDYITHFKVIFKDIKLNPLWWVAKYNLASSGNSFDQTQSKAQGYMFTWSQAMTSLGITKQTTSYNEWGVPATPKTVTNASADQADATWHLPCEKELKSILPGNENTLTANPFNYASFDEATMIYSEDECIFGYDATTRSGITPKSVWTSKSTSGGTTTFYAIRYLGTEFCSAWRYEEDSDKGTFTSRLIDTIEPDDKDAIQAMFAEMTAQEGGVYTFWESSKLTDEEGGAQRIFWRCGYGSSGPATPPAGNGNGHYFSTTEVSSSQVRVLHIIGYLEIGTNNKGYGFPLRLFRDE